MLYFEEEETKNEQKITMYSLVCDMGNVLNFVLILYFSSIRRDVEISTLQLVHHSS